MGKKLVALVLSMLLCLALFVPAALANPATTNVRIPSCEASIYVRSGPGTQYKVLGEVKSGDEIDLLSVGSSWSKIRVARTGLQGYISNTYIADLPKDNDHPDMTGTASAGIVSAKSVNLRFGPGTGFASYGTLTSGTKLKLWSSKGNWYYVSTMGGTAGWVSKSYVRAGYATTTKARVNFRETPNGAMIRTLPVGASVSVISFTGSWAQVKVSGRTGYVFTSYLK